MQNEQKFEISSGNIFTDLELENPNELTLKSDLIIQLRSILKDLKITQRDAASRLKSTQPTVSKVLRGDLDRVSIETLLEWLHILGKRMEYRFCKMENADCPTPWREAR
ncbi:XRE family transcriptional regulator [Desulfovibrio sulfodismutans]|uniref:XRE family transcriptional regulator n=1 Tax=Desulfolutivibrio sulfodismutans TaxID=63561 RepID=A0A7K3NKB4_9BACT|nr:helix-turn-helix transcriptional regulator [Desulfolutivibrio sulfodismutans]NDY56195.1 XRE family transcriptional regulator [Desulfolutivibrio sulfodismutans]QLA12372.1 helix-turn-helix domain-containing protein [Desulfolutivibrio sulfodismutans DSM 3696]